MKHKVEKLVFVGFNSRVAALEADTGEIVWNWRASSMPSGGYVTLMLLNPEQLIVAVSGYIYCLRPLDGEQLWYNETRGFGTGVTSLAALGARGMEPQTAAAETKARDTSST
jgi:outer membrane protein assembly factor BamB